MNPSHPALNSPSDLAQTGRPGAFLRKVHPAHSFVL
jgi:hypothetical protein